MLLTSCKLSCGFFHSHQRKLGLTDIVLNAAVVQVVAVALHHEHGIALEPLEK